MAKQIAQHDGICESKLFIPVAKRGIIENQGFGAGL
jgi:hypothetical protein